MCSTGLQSKLVCGITCFAALYDQEGLVKIDMLYTFWRVLPQSHLDRFGRPKPLLFSISGWLDLHTSYSGTSRSSNEVRSSNEGAVSTTRASTSLRTENCHISRMVTIVGPDSSVWAGKKACFTPSTANIIQPDPTRAWPKPAEEGEILMTIQLALFHCGLARMRSVFRLLLGWWA